jgi:hypothetical protein
MKKTEIYSSDITKSQREYLFSQFPSIFKRTGIDKNNFKMTITNNAPPRILYHYTSLNTLQTILGRMEDEEKTCQNETTLNCLVLRGTHIEFLNDVMEFKLAASLMADLIKEYEYSLDAKANKRISNRLDEEYWKKFATFHGLMTPPFITSFSENQDSLPMWKAYGHDGKGVAIGIEKIQFNKSNFKSSSGCPVWVKCSYDSKRLKEIFSLGIAEIYKIFEFRDERLTIKGFPDFVSLSAYFSMLKNFAYEYEQEWRLVKNYSSSNSEKEIYFQEKDGFLRPYVEHFLPKDFLKEIVIGPCSDFEILKKSLKMSLERAGYSVNKRTKDKSLVKLKASKIPFRHI